LGGTSTVERRHGAINGARFHFTGRDAAFIGWAEQITASSGNAKPYLQKQEKNKQGPPFFRRKPRLWSDRRERTGDYFVQASE
jgi:hypothetical protein